MAGVVGNWQDALEQVVEKLEEHELGEFNAQRTELDCITLLSQKHILE